MSTSYGPLASWYDALTGDVPYGEFLAFYESEFARGQGEYHTVLEIILAYLIQRAGIIKKCAFAV